MTIEELQSKYGEEPDWENIPAMDFYQVLDGNRDLWEALHNDGVLLAHQIFQPIRRRVITDLYFANLFFWDANPFGGPDTPISENKITLESHKHLIDMFVKKNPDLSVANQTSIKNRLILYPRGTQKSSLGIFDVIQWVLLDPKIRILVISAADDLAAAIVDEVRGFFTIKEPVPTLMNMFFPEHCLQEKDLPASGEFSTPEWTKLQIRRREATIMSRGLTAAVSGFHFEVFHGDDAVETRNSTNDEQCKGVRKRYGISRNTLRKFGYTTLLGTRYHEEDLYGDIIAKAEMGEFTNEEYSICEKKTYNPGKGVEILIGQEMTIKADAEMEMVKYNVPRQLWFRKAGRLGVTLLMPHESTYEECLVRYEDDPEAYETQRRQNVMPPTQQMFTRELILKNTVNWMDLPLYGRVTHCWDLNGGKGKKDNDMCVGTACLWDSNGVGHIIDLVCANYPTHVSIAQAVVQFARKHHPDTISIEDSLGMRMIEPTIWAEADKTGDDFVKNLVRHIYWRPVDTTKDAKKNRIASLYPQVLYGKIKFASTLPERERMITQFIKPITKSSKNDIPDCIAFQMHFQPNAPATKEQRDKIEAEMKRRREQEIGKSTWEMLFTENQGINYPPINYEVPQEEVVMQSPSPYTESDGLDNILGYGLTG